MAQLKYKGKVIAEGLPALMAFIVALVLTVSIPIVMIMLIIKTVIFTYHFLFG